MTPEAFSVLGYLATTVVAFGVGYKTGKSSGFKEGHKAGWHEAWKRKEQMDKIQKEKDESHK